MDGDRRKITVHAAIALFAAAAVITVAWTTGPFYFHFQGMRLVTTYSFFQLLAAAYAAFLACRSIETKSSLKWRQNPSARPFFISSIGFLYLGMDEVLSLHENMDKLFHLILRTKATPVTDHLDDLIVLAYGIVAIFFVKDFIRELKKHPYMVGLIVCGFIAFLTMFCFDFVSNNGETFTYFFRGLDYSAWRHRQDVFGMIEDSFKILGEAFFLAAFTAALTDIRTRRKINP